MFEDLLGQYGWIAITFGLGFFFKESIINMIQGMLVFIGNDFIHNLPSINIRYGGLDQLLETYNICQKDFEGYFYLIDNDSLNVKNFKYFIKLRMFQYNLCLQYHIH